jgi:hypothetical protein
VAFNVFRIAASGGSNANSGTTASVIYTSSIAVWDGTSQITGISGVSGVVNINDWVNVASVYIAQVTATSSTGFTLSTTAKYGTAPGAGTVTVTDGGYFASQVAITAIFGTATVFASTQFQWQAGNAAFTLSGALTIGVVGTTTAPVWHRGFNTTPGDLDNGSTTLAYPTIVCGANTFTSGGAFSTWTGFAISTTRSGPTVTVTTGANQSFRHCQFTNTAANAAAFAATLSGVSGTEFTKCYFSTTSTATEIVNVGNNIASFNGCWFAGAASGTTQIGILFGTAMFSVVGCTFYKCGSSAMKTSVTNSGASIIGNTFYKSGSDHITLTGTLTVPVTVANNLFVNAGTNGSGYDINNSSGTNTALIRVLNNSWYNPASGHTNGLGDTVFDNELAESTLPVVSDTNLAVLSTSLAANGGLPQQWEAQTAGLGGFPDVGAWQRKNTSSSGPSNLPINIGTAVGIGSTI